MTTPAEYSTAEIDLTQFDGHTPGPWGIEDCWIESDSGCITAVLRGNASDGALIAAAPTLLAEIVRLRAKLAEAEGQEPAAWIEHEWSGSGQQYLHFSRRKESIRDEVVCPTWTALYARSVPAIPAGWLPIKTAPKDGTAVLSLLAGSDVAHSVRWLESGHKFANGTAGWRIVWDLSQVSLQDGPDYWMPIPAAPEAAR